MAETTVGTKRIRLDGLETLELTRLDGSPASLKDFQGKLLLLVNVASRCGFTPQYAGLEKLYQTYGSRGLTVLGFPCNQFGEQEPGTAEEIANFCQVNYRVTFPLFAKIEVNGPNRHPLYARLTEAADFKGRTGDIAWNFEKFLLDRDGRVVARFSPPTTPDDPRVISAVEDVLESA